MSFRRTAPIVPTRLAALSPAAAIGVLFALLLLIGAGLTLPPNPNPGGAPGGGDAQLYRQISARVAQGQNYYQAAAVEHRASNYPLKPANAVRTPIVAEITATLGEAGADMLLRLLTIAAIAATVMRLAPQLRAPYREAAILLSATSATAFVQAGMSVWHEVWAGLLITLALACRTERRWFASVGLGLAAALIRELAFPFLLVMAATAWTSGARREAQAWLAASAIAIISLAAHMAAVWALTLPGDVASPGWMAFGGWRFDLALARQSSLIMVLPPWAAAVTTPLALLGWCAWRSPYALRTAALLMWWMGAFLVLGRPDNSYWGFLFAPLLPVGLAMAPDALRDLIRAVRCTTAEAVA